MANTSNKAAVLGLFTELLFPGGIQRVGRSVAAVLKMHAQERGLQCRLLSLNDPVGSHELEVGGVRFTVQGVGRNKVGFFTTAVRNSAGAAFVYINHPNLSPLGLALRTVRPGLRYTVSTHGVDVWEPLTALRRMGLLSAHMVTAPSRFTAEKIASIQRVSPRNTIVMPWALDPVDDKTAKESTEKPGHWREGKMLLSVARLAATEKYKRVDAVIRTMPEVLRTIPDAYYVIVGDGDDRPDLERQVQNLGLKKHIVFTGFCSDQELEAYYRHCDVFVMPSAKEGFGLVYIEAMRFAKPVIASRDAATPEVVIDKETGVLLEGDDQQALTNAIVGLLSDQQRRIQLGEAGKNRVEAHYTFRQFHDRFRRLFDACETGKRPEF